MLPVRLNFEVKKKETHVQALFVYRYFIVYYR
jgi:hypothetical protein